MFFSISLYIALLVCAIGLVYKVTSWFRYRIGRNLESVSAGRRFAASIRGVVRTLFGRNLPKAIWILIADVLFQRRIFKENFLRWLMHMCIFGGFMLLLLMHALDAFVSAKLFSDYQPTLNPFLFLRNLFGALVIAGLIIAVLRRIYVKKMRLTSHGMDYYAIAILAVIMISGIVLEASKIVSYQEFKGMVDEWAMLEGDEAKPLKVYWAKEFGVVFPEPLNLNDPDVLQEGGEMHENYCASCHSKPQSAFLSYGVSRIIRPAAVGWTQAGAATILWYIHILACFVGLAYLPFSKFLHILVSPLSLLANGVTDPDTRDPAVLLTRRAMELDACTHCGTCTEHCSVGMVYRCLSNSAILPSEKLMALREVASGSSLSEARLRTIQEGSYICTQCYRCTNVCPVGINLQDLWIAMREDLAQEGYPDPCVWAREELAAEYGAQVKGEGLLVPPETAALRSDLGVSLQASTFSVCFECQTCTNVCPVVQNYENPKEVLGLLPHQIMHSLALGLEEQALGNAMIWDCATCYLCQEQCPQGVQVTDVFYELKNRAYRHRKESPPAGGDSEARSS